ncbi:MAG: AAA family ATPase [Bacteroidales bacterium]|nr:AAA family ATPase [Bacteroidales bacterium]MCM1146446.1 AAA family ATPase [Bacteroidales bacterium]MCM1205116.1 AAA family ATPase [Bacillota bacterium]MCM1509363.1 AAA family ATPase [Clostridium sp.]
MEKYAEYIRQVEIPRLWGGRKHILWTLDPEVNVLSGANGIGKSSILRHVISGVKAIAKDAADGVILKTCPEDATLLKFDIISTPDVRSEFDINLNGLQERIIHYPHAGQWSLFCDIVDELFSATGKTVNRDAGKVELIQWGDTLDLRLLSSGEKQMLIILMTVLLEDCDYTVLFMDEPEVSLHVEWQQVLIETIRRLNPNAQIIMSTHSPAIIMNGWLDKVTEVSDITIG